MALLSACQSPSERLVAADRYDSFWLWAGVKPQPVLKDAKRLYLFYGELTVANPARLTILRPGTPHLPGQELWLVVRVETLRWSPQVFAQILTAVQKWRQAGNSVAGVQIDFDAHTQHLDDYADFLATLRQKLPKNCKLSITGLLDWSANGDPAQLQNLQGSVDELVLQTYQGRRTIPGYQAYFGNVAKVTIQFRIGLVQGGEWSEPAALRANPYFKGYVVFLVNPPGDQNRGRSLPH